MSELQAAESAWAAANPSCPTYHYVINPSAGFDCVGLTTVQITDGQPTERIHVNCGANWDEVGASQIGTHPEGAPARTIEELFAVCATDLDQDPANYKLLLTVGADGVPTTCGATLTQCIDSCFTGFQISSFACGTLVKDAGTDTTSG
jgi:hypothetical protein